MSSRASIHTPLPLHILTDSANNQASRFNREPYMATLDDKISELESKLKQAKAKKQQLDARKRSAESKSQRIMDIRKKILVGGAILSNVESGQWPKEKLLTLLDSVLVRPDDRALFDLPIRSLPSTPSSPDH